MVGGDEEDLERIGLEASRYVSRGYKSRWGFGSLGCGTYGCWELGCWELGGWGVTDTYPVHHPTQGVRPAECTRDGDGVTQCHVADQGLQAQQLQLRVGQVPVHDTQQAVHARGTRQLHPLYLTQGKVLRLLQSRHQCTVLWVWDPEGGGVSSDDSAHAHMGVWVRPTRTKGNHMQPDSGC